MSLAVDSNCNCTLRAIICCCRCARASASACFSSNCEVIVPCPKEFLPSALFFALLRASSCWLWPWLSVLLFGLLSPPPPLPCLALLRPPSHFATAASAPPQSKLPLSVQFILLFALLPQAVVQVASPFLHPSLCLTSEPPCDPTFDVSSQFAPCNELTVVVCTISIVVLRLLALSKFFVLLGHVSVRARKAFSPPPPPSPPPPSVHLHKSFVKSRRGT